MGDNMICKIILNLKVSDYVISLGKKSHLCMCLMCPCPISVSSPRNNLQDLKMPTIPAIMSVFVGL